MKTRAPFSALLLLTLMMAFMAAPAFAQTAIPFPFFSTNASDMAALRQGFGLQWALFGGFSGSSGSALYYLALAAAFCGALLLIFNKGFQRLPTIAAWGVLVIIMLFAPYNSRLLFYPLNPSDKECKQNTPSISDSGLCGFTPQLVAVHIGSVLFVLFKDLFESQGMTDMVECGAARGRMGSLEMAKPNDGTRYTSNNLQKWCGNSAVPAPVRMQQGTFDTNKNGSPVKLGDVINHINDSYAGNSNGGVPAPAFALATKPEQLGFSGANDPNWAKYVDGLNAIYSKWLSGSGKSIYLTSQMKDATDTSRMLSVEQGVAEIKEYMTQTYLNNSGGSPDPNMVSPGDIAFFLTSLDANGTIPTSQNGMDLTLRGRLNTDSDNLGRYLSGSASGSGTVLADFLDLVKSSSVLQNMPVALIEYSRSCAQSGQNSTANDVASTPDCKVKPEVFGTMDCNRMSALESARMCTSAAGLNMPPNGSGGSGEQGSVQNLPKENVCNYIAGDSSVPLKELCAPTSVAAGSSYQVTGDAATICNAVEVCPEGNDSAEAAWRMMQGHIQETQAVTNPTTSITDANGNDVPMYIGSYGKFAGTLAGWLGEAAAQVGAVFTGALAMAYIMILKNLLNLAMVAIPVVTPIFFIMGLLIPGNAPGLLFLSIMSMMVIKLVPVTWLVINYIATIIGTGLEGTKDAAFNQALLYYGVAGLYLSSVGLTLFMMFKIGDPGNLARIASMDNAAKQVGEAGINIAKSVAAIAASIAMPAALGAGAQILKGSKKLPEVPGNTGGARPPEVTKTPAELAAEQAEKQLDDMGIPPFNPGDETDEALANEWGKIDTGDYKQDRLNAEAKDFDKTFGGVPLGDEGIVAADEDARLTSAWEKSVEGSDLTKAGVDPIENWENEGGAVLQEALPDAPKTAVDPNPPAKGGDKPGNPPAGGNDKPADATGGAGGPPTEPGAPGSGGAAGEPTGTASNVFVQGGKLDTIGDAKVDGTGDKEVGTTGKTEDGTPPAGTPNERKVALEKAMEGFSPQQTDAVDKATQMLNTGDVEAASAAIKEVAGDDIKLMEKMSVAASMGASTEGKDLTDALLQETRRKFADTIGARQNEILQERVKMDRALGGRLEGADALDYAPRWKRAMLGGLSGAIGGIKGNQGALAAIPVVGNAISESLNERYEAGERMRGWAARSGYRIDADGKVAKGTGIWEGIKQRRRDTADAARGQFWARQTSEMAAADNYRSLGEAGAFQGQVNAARQAAREAAAMTRSNYEAMLSRQQIVNNDNNINVSQGVMTAEQLKGVGTMNAVMKVNQLQVEGAMMQKGRIMTGDGDTEVELGTRVIDHIAGASALKGFSSNIDQMMTTHYKVVEKRQRQDDAFGRASPYKVTPEQIHEDGATTAYQKERLNVRNFIREDVDADYRTTALMDIILTKAKFMEMAGTFEELKGMYSENIEQKVQLKPIVEAQYKQMSTAQKSEIAREMQIENLPQAQKDQRIIRALYSLPVNQSKLAVGGIHAVAMERGRYKTRAQSESSYAELKALKEEYDDKGRKMMNDMFSGNTKLEQHMFKGRRILDQNSGLSVEVKSYFEEATRYFGSNMKGKQNDAYALMREVEKFATGRPKFLQSEFDKETRTVRYGVDKSQIPAFIERINSSIDMNETAKRDAVKIFKAMEREEGTFLSNSLGPKGDTSIKTVKSPGILKINKQVKEQSGKKASERAYGLGDTVYTKVQDSDEE